MWPHQRVISQILGNRVSQRLRDMTCWPNNALSSVPSLADRPSVRRWTVIRVLKIWAALLFCQLALSTPLYGSHREFISLVTFKSPNLEEGTLVGKVGHRFTATVTYQIGWFHVDHSGGPINVKESLVTKPQYHVFGDLPPGLAFDGQRGVLQGVPTAPGKWLLRGAVRDSIRGDSVYHGRAYWFSEYVNYSGQTWTASKGEITIDIRE
jgi:hypothetical protein